MLSFFDARQLLHAPALQLHDGGWTEHSETASRAEAIAAKIGGLSTVQDFGMAPLRRVHAQDYLDFLATAHARWIAEGREGEAVGSAWPIVQRRALSLERIDGLLGRFSFDANSPIMAHTWQAAYWSTQTALSALQPLLDGVERSSFALCRPPGHHAGRDYCGGYCYLNNAAIAAQAALDAGRGSVAILDIDFHHGNGTQDIFLELPDVFFCSVHADPVLDYPFFWGHADEVGIGDGVGATLNLPLPRGTAFAAYLQALDQALEAISRFNPRLLILSFGADTFEGDPIAWFALLEDDYPRLAARIASVDLPTLIVMEGGYSGEALGNIVAGFLGEF